MDWSLLESIFVFVVIYHSEEGLDVATKRRGTRQITQRAKIAIGGTV